MHREVKKEHHMCERHTIFGDLDERQLLSLAAYYEHVTPRPDGIMTGKSVLVTGADHGLGERLVASLARHGATVVMVARDRTHGEAARLRISRATGSQSVELILADLSSQASIRELAAEYQSRHAELHVLVNGGHAMSPRRTVTADGVERTLAVNHLAPFLLTSLLLDQLQANAPSRIVNISSPAHRFRSVDLTNLQGETDYHPQRIFAQSKLINLLYTFELARKLTRSGVTVNAAEPEITWPAAGAALPSLPPARNPRGSFIADPEVATPLHLAVSPELERVSGGYFAMKRRVEPSRRALDPTLAKEVWHLSERLTGLAQVALAS